MRVVGDGVGVEAELVMQCAAHPLNSGAGLRVGGVGKVEQYGRGVGAAAGGSGRRER
jgi:hypothetical protein